MADQVLSSKLVGERVTVTFDFVDEFEWGEVVLETFVTVTVLVGTDNNPSDLRYLSPVFVGRVVTQQLWHGLPGVIYQVECTVLGTSGNVYTKVAKLAILPIVNENPPLAAVYLTSKPYPITDLETFGTFGHLTSVKVLSWPTESLGTHSAFLSAIVDTILILYSAEPEAVGTSSSFLSANVYASLESYSGLPEAIGTSAEFLTAVVDTILIIYFSEPEAYQTHATFISATIT